VKEGWRAAWFAALLIAVLFEGMGRKYLPGVPQPLLYFAKDGILLIGWVSYGIAPQVRHLSRRVYSPFHWFWWAAVIVTAAQACRTDHPSVLLGVLGLRAYWLWWLAPLVLATAVGRPAVLDRATQTLAVASMLVSAVAVYQFNAPVDARVNQYAWSGEGDESVAIVSSTGRVRVSGTFAYLSGFSNFSVIILPTLLALAQAKSRRSTRALCVAAAAAVGATGVLSGSRSFLAYGAVTLPIVLGIQRALVSVKAIRAVAVLALAAVASMWFFPDAFDGLRSRLDDPEETVDRLTLAAGFLPPIALLLFDYPTLGLGTGVMMTGAQALGVEPAWLAEVEPHRILVEQGLVGFVLISVAKFGLAAALLRLYGAIQKREQDFSRLALALVPLGLVGQIVMDHTFQAMFFLCVGLVGAHAAQTQGRTPPLTRRRPKTLARSTG
jgi:hypothetical protein